MENYRVNRAIGKGSFGKVYLATHVKENRSYVLKVVSGPPPQGRERAASTNARAHLHARTRARTLLPPPRLLLQMLRSLLLLFRPPPLLPPRR